MTEQHVINLNINDARIAEAAEKFKDIDAHQDLPAAKEAKKFLTKMRTTLAEAHKIQKAESLAFGRRLDGEKNRLLDLIARVEDPISDQLTEIKEAEAKIELERIAKIDNEIERIKAFANDRHDLTLDQLGERRATLSKIVITEEFFQEFTTQAELFKQEANAKLLIAYKAESDRMEEARKQEQIAEEQAAKQKELDDRQAALDSEEAKRKEEQAERDREASKKLAKENAARQKQLDDQATEQADKQKKLDDVQAEEDRLAKEAEEAEAAALRAPDTEKLEVFAKSIEGLIEHKLPMQSQEGSNVMLYAESTLTDLVESIRKAIEEMK